MKTTIIFILAVICISFSTSAQSFFKPIPKTVPNYKLVAGGRSFEATTPLPDSTFVGFRPIASAVYGYTKDGGSTILAGAGISYEHDTYQTASGKWYTDWSISLQGYAGGSQAPTSVAMVTAVGLSGAFFNKLLVVGIGYNISNKNFMPLAGPGVSLDN